MFIRDFLHWFGPSVVRHHFCIVVEHSLIGVMLVRHFTMPGIISHTLLSSVVLHARIPLRVRKTSWPTIVSQLWVGRLRLHLGTDLLIVLHLFIGTRSQVVVFWREHLFLWFFIILQA